MLFSLNVQQLTADTFNAGQINDKHTGQEKIKHAAAKVEVVGEKHECAKYWPCLECARL